MFGSKTTFGSPANSAFGGTSTLFGGASKAPTQTTTNLFGQPSVGLGGTSTLFGGSAANTVSWGSGVVGAPTGTAIPFNPPITTDTIQRGGQSTQVNAKHVCITAMKEYQDKSLEELRLEDYGLNRHGSAGGATSSLFGASSAVKPFQFSGTQTAGTTSIFGQTTKPTNTLFGGGNLTFGSSTSTAQPIFGQTAQTQNTSTFGAKPLFGAASTGTSGLFGSTQPSTGFAFGQTQQTAGLGATTNIFGQSTLTSSAAKPSLFGTQPAFGAAQSTNLFGVKTTGTTSLFGTSAPLAGSQTQTGFGFGGALKPAGTTGFFGTSTATTAPKPGGIFGIGATTTTTGFGFGAGLATTQTPAFGGFGTNTSTNVGLFGQNSANTLGAKKTFGFGSSLTNPTAPSTGVFGFGQTNPSGGLFGNTAASGTTGFGFGSTPGTTSLFGQNTGFGTAQKPLTTGFGLGSTGLAATGFGTSGTGTSLFGLGSSGLAAGASATRPLGFGTTTQLSNGLGGLASNTAEQLAQNVRAQQQVLELVRSMPYGQSPLFRYLNMPSADGVTEESKQSNAMTNMTSGSASSSSLVVPAKAVASALAERHKAAGLILGSGSPGATVVPSPTAGGRPVWMRRPAVNQKLLQVSNRNKLFSGFYEEDALLSPSAHGTSPALRLRRSATLGSDSALLDSPSLGTKNGGRNFFVRRDEWKRLHLPESVRTSILERSAASTQELSSMAEATLNEDREEELQSGATSDGVTSPAHRESGFGAGDSSGVNTNKPSHTTSVPQVSASPSSTRSVVSSPNRAPTTKKTHAKSSVGFVRAREALRDDSALTEDLDSTWTSPGDATSGDLSTTDGISAHVSPSSKKSQSNSGSVTSAPSSPRPPHPTGIKLSKPGYYVLPPFEELATMMDSEGRCIVEDFVIGRRHYGHILFPGNTDVTDLDLDNIVHIRRREVVVYPDDEKKPPVGFGLNKRAEVCLEAIWPTDKATREPVKSPERLAVMRFEDRLERATRRMDARFIEYRPESGSWVFEVKHFSKYRLDDSDEESEPQNDEADTKKDCNLSSKELELQSDMDLTGDFPGDEKTLNIDKTPVFRRSMLTPTTKSITGPVNGFTKIDAFSSDFTSPTCDKCEQSMELTLQSDTVANLPQDFSAPSATVRQMRNAFFRLSSQESYGNRRSGLFSRYDDEYDEIAELEAAAEDTDRPFGLSTTMRSSAQGIKRFQSPLVHQNSFASPIGIPSQPKPESGNEVWIKKMLHSGPSPEKIIRTRSPFRSAADDSNRLDIPKMQDDGSDEYNSLVVPVTPFRPISCEEISEGVPLNQDRTPPLEFDLNTLRIPSPLKQISGPFSTGTAVTEAGLLPYATLFQLFPHAQTKKGRKKAVSSSDCMNRLSHLVLDITLQHGHGLRPSWSRVRLEDYCSTVLITSELSDSVPSPSWDRNFRPTSGFTISINPWPSVIEKTDETLLNAALTTSVRRNFSPDSQKPNLSPPTDHCPFWEPDSGLAPLEAYVQALHCDFPEILQSAKDETRTARVAAVSRLVSLCLALWGRHPLEQTVRSATDVDGTSKKTESNVEQSAQKEDNASSHSLPLDGMQENPCDEEQGPSLPALAFLCRKQAVSEWIRSHSYPWLEKRLRSLGLFDVVKVPNSDSDANNNELIPGCLENHKTDDISEGLFACLVSGEPGAACRLALAASMPGLAALIAQCTAGDPIVRRGLQRQIMMWHEMKYDRHIPIPLLRIYALLAGLTHFPHPKQSCDVTVLANLDWTRVFGAYLWYLSDYSSNLSEVLRLYSMAWHSTEAVSDQSIGKPVPPEEDELLDPEDFPSLVNDYPESMTSDNGGGEDFKTWPRDTAYNLLQLFCGRAHRLERTLNPCGISRRKSQNGISSCSINPSSLLDWAPSWNLWRILTALGYQHYDAITPSRLCGEFAAQLEDAGLWEWAVFVLLHEADQMRRDMGVKSVIERNASLVLPATSSDSIQDVHKGISLPDRLNELLDSLSVVPPPPLTKAESFVTEKLGVPIRWIHEAKAVLARHRFASCNRELELSHLDSRSFSHSRKLRLQAHLFAILEASHWFAAGHFGAAHAVYTEYLLPNLVLHTDSSLSSTSGLALTRMGHRLEKLLQPFTTLTAAQLPDGFSNGVGIYLVYDEILRLAEQLSNLCHNPSGSVEQKQESSMMEGTEEEDKSAKELEQETQERLAETLCTLRIQLRNFIEDLRHMTISNLNVRVVRTEMAATCTRLISAFLAVGVSEVALGTDASDLRAGTLDCLQRQLLSITEVGLPADYHLKEVRTFTEAKLSIGVV
ncbi:unnamed protein product [Calicophoron daubneyi]|uniref:Nuclear pore complex protein Nup98-Nup96 n=1 Tax=Calicophoron daubneyi TaxID=300641 RepID=A0AAV2T2U8_CALDB